MLLHGLGSRLKLRGHAAHLSCGGGERGSSWTEESRSTTRMVPLHSGHLGSVTVGLAPSAMSSALVRSDCTAKQSEAERQQLGSLAVGEEAEVADADEAAWQQVQQEAAQELVCGQAHDALPVVMRGVSPAEADLAVSEGDQPAVGDADAMGIRAEVAQGMFRSAEGPLGVDDPVVAEQDSEPGGEAAWFSRVMQGGRGTRACLRGTRP